jgi:hypothetical protein
MATEDVVPARDQIIEYLRSLPANISPKEILYHVYIRSQIIEAQEEIKNGQFYTDEEAAELLKA